MRWHRLSNRLYTKISTPEAGVSRVGPCVGVLLILTFFDIVCCCRFRRSIFAAETDVFRVHVREKTNRGQRPHFKFQYLPLNPLLWGLPRSHRFHGKAYFNGNTGFFNGGGAVGNIEGSTK